MRILPAMILLSSACGDGNGSDEDTDAGTSGPAIAGIYEVTHHTESILLDVDCVTEGNERTDPPYIQVRADTGIGGEAYGVHPCDTADEASCVDMESLGYLDTPEVDGWTGVIPYSRTVGDSCDLSYLHHRAIVADDRSLRLEGRRYGETVPVAEVSCSAEEAQRRGAAMPCESYEVIVADFVR